MWIAAVLLTGTGVLQFVDGFDYPNGADGAPSWLTESVAWEIQGEALVFDGGDRSFAVFEQAGHGSEVSVEAVVTVHEKRGTDWSIAGVCVRRDAGNYWHLALVEAPEHDGKRHFVELSEMLEGRWLAHHAPETRLTAIESKGSSFSWEYGRSYRLRLELTPERVDGRVLEHNGSEVAHLAFRLDNRAVASGRPALDGAGFRVAFDDFTALLSKPVPAPDDVAQSFPAYEGVSAGPVIGEATGFFRTQAVDDRWWMVDPLGRAFYAVGSDHIRYTGHWCQELGYAPYARVTEAKYGGEENWSAATIERLDAWGFNALGAAHSESLRHRRFPHMGFLGMGATFSGIEDICPKIWWTGFPNVFSPKWPRHCDLFARQHCAPNRDDSWLIGYFIDNELEWFGKSYQEWGLFEEAWKKGPDHSAKQAWVEFLQRALKGPSEFETHWGVAVRQWEDLSHHTQPAPPLTEQAEGIARDWVRLAAERYFGECARAIRRHDPNHLVLGSRFAGNAPDIWDIAGRHCDVVSFNLYPRIDVERGVPERVVTQLEGWQRAAGKPMMITEWSFPALDSGLPCRHGAGMRVDTQTQRARCFEHFQTLMFSLPFMVGSDFFMFVDEPAPGISESFPEDTNYGLVSEQDEPYEKLTQTASRLNREVVALHEAGVVETAAIPRLAPWLAETPEDVTSVERSPLTLRAGELTLEGPTEGHWRLAVGGTALGVWRPLLHQETGEDLWVDADRGRVVQVRRNDQVTVVEVEFARGERADAITRVDAESGQTEVQHGRPRRFRSGWRFWVPKGAHKWFASQCLWVENVDDAPWRLAEVFHYVVPAIGGDAAHDEPLSGDVPNYYRRGAAWVDADAGLGVGCWYTAESDFDCHYWKDPGGGFHADLRRRVDVLLEPGRRFEPPGALAFFLPLRDVSRAGFSRAVENLEHTVTE